MPEKLCKRHRNDFNKILECLKPIKSLRAGVNTIHGIPPTEEELREYERAVGGLSSVMGKLPDATYNVYLRSMGDYHKLCIGISDMDVSSLRRLEDVAEIIFKTVEENSLWRPRDPGLPHNKKEVEEVVSNLIRNNGDLEYFDKISFFLYH